MNRSSRLLACALLSLASLAAAPAMALDEGWPRELRQGGNVLRYYQPQIDGWEQHKVLKGRMAVVLTAAGAAQPLAGAVWLRGDTTTDLDRRTVFIENLSVERVSFSVAEAEKAAAAEATVRAMIPRDPITLSLNRLLARLEATERKSDPLPLRNAPPRIIVSQSPARLVNLDGEPVFAPIPGTELQYAVNTNWTLINVMATATYYLLDDKTWLTATAITGPWTIAGSLPPSFARIPNDDNWKDVRQAIAAPQRQYEKAPRIHLATEPAELIVIRGKPQLEAVGQGTDGPSYVANTDADLFFFRGDSSWYYLVAGRWFRARSLDGPWVYATPELPAAFARIPPGHKKSRVLASIPNTPQAQEAVLVAGIPQTATVKKTEARLEVDYGGAPEFRPIENTPLAYALNASTPVIKVSDTAYYACERAIWFTAPTPTGPWMVAASIPASIYTIPASAPVYNVTYVTTQETSPDTVTTSYTAGYLGGFITAGLLAWGTGYYYPPYWRFGPIPAYYPRPYTYGASAWYNPATNTYFRGGAAYGPYGGFGAGAAYNASTGAYARGVAAYGPYGGFKVGSAYNPSTGAWARGAAGYGPYGAGRAGYGYNPSTGVGFAGAQGSNVYGSWGNAVVTKGDEWARAGYRSTSQGTAAGVRTSQGTGALGYQTAGGQQGGVVKGQNNTYVGHDGNVYRKTDSGWQKYDNGSWTGAAPSAQRATGSSGAQGRAATAQAQQRPAPADLGAALDPRGAATQRPAMQQPNVVRGDQGLNRAAPSASVYDDLNRERVSRQSGAQRDQAWQSEYSARSNFNVQGGGARAGGRGGRR